MKEQQAVERDQFEAWRKAQAWAVVTDASAADEGDDGSFKRLMDLAAWSAWQARAQPSTQEPVGAVIDQNGGHNTASLPPTAMAVWFGGLPPIGTKLYASPVTPEGAASEAVGWQPIETAPKDGTRIVAWIEWYDGAQAHTGAFKGGEFWPDFRSHESKMPTRWHPLPAPLSGDTHV